MPEIFNLPDLIVLLKQGTDRGSIKWKETADQNTFRCSFGKGTVEITREYKSPILPPWSAQPTTAFIFAENKSLSRPYWITLFDEKNNLLGELCAKTEGEIQAMRELYDQVRRSALHLDQAIEALMREIKVLASGK